MCAYVYLPILCALVGTPSPLSPSPLPSLRRRLHRRRGRPNNCGSPHGGDMNLSFSRSRARVPLWRIATLWTYCYVYIRIYICVYCRYSHIYIYIDKYDENNNNSNKKKYTRFFLLPLFSSTCPFCKNVPIVHILYIPG